MTHAQKLQYYYSFSEIPSTLSGIQETARKKEAELPQMSVEELKQSPVLDDEEAEWFAKQIELARNPPPTTVEDGK